MRDHRIALRPPERKRRRLMLGKLFTPNRMKENEAIMWGLAERLIAMLLDEVEVDTAYPLAVRVPSTRLGGVEDP